MIAKSALARLRAPSPSRRGFLKGAAAGILIVGVHLDARVKPGFAQAAKAPPPMPNAFIKVAPDNTVTVLIKHLDMGQGTSTGLATIVAEELDADWSQIRVEFAPANPALYNNLFFGPVQGTGGSTSIANSWMQLRQAGAAARAMLVTAAADAWKVPAAEITAAKGVVMHRRSGKRATFGELAAKAASLPVPAEVRFKDAGAWSHIGKPLPRIDSVAKTTGQAVYAMDVKRPGMLTAVLARSPRFGGLVKSVDGAAAKAIKGVVDVVSLPDAVAVLARDTWSAIRGRAALKIEWDDSKAERRSSAAILDEYRRLAITPGKTAARRGDADAGLRSAAKVLEAEFVFPFLAHAPMEPLNGVIEVKANEAEIWAGSQLQTVEQATVAGILGLEIDQIKINTLWAGGSFGRRATPSCDYFAEMAQVAKASGARAPIHLVWTREDDIKGGAYRPLVLHRVRAGLDAAGSIVGWQHRIVSQSFIIGSPFEQMIVKDGIDHTAVEGAADTPYAIPNFTVEWHHVTSPITTLWWRSVGHTHTAYVMETMIDALAREAGKDPVAYRLALLGKHPRHVGVLKLAADRGGWGARLGSGKGRGIAVHESFQSYVAMVADVTTRHGRLEKVDRIVAAVDCGIAINPDVVRAQVESAVGYGLGAALRNKITLTDGLVDQANFDGYEPLRISDMPKVEVHIVASRAAPTGIGEPGVPPTAPAVANAIFAAAGKRLHALPWS
jgi:isoquinoline 1-oxidoreductase beta subunit